LNPPETLDTIFESSNIRISELTIVDPRIIADHLKAFSHPTRLAILQELVVGPRCVTDMEELLPARQANISQHLAVLRNVQLVDYAQDGALRCYYLCRPQLVKDMLALMGRDDPVIRRTSAEIQADKARLARSRAEEEAVKPATRRRKASP
jgi:ArsR family transcriptional regulator